MPNLNSETRSSTIRLEKKIEEKFNEMQEKRLKKADGRDFPTIKDGRIPKDYEPFNEMIGLPLNRNTGKPSPMTSYQIEYHETVEKYHKVILNKTRKGGFTDARIRSNALNTFGRYAGHDVMIVAGNELVVAMEILDRFDELFEKGFTDLKGKKWAYSDLIKRYAKSPQPMVEFYNGTRHFCFAASKSAQSQSFRGPDDVISIFFSEAAHTGMENDTPIWNALTPNLANRDDGDLVLESTPNGKRGIFYEIWSDVERGINKSYHPLRMDYKEALKYGVLSAKFIQQQKEEKG